MQRRLCDIEEGPEISAKNDRRIVDNFGKMSTESKARIYTTFCDMKRALDEPELLRYMNIVKRMETSSPSEYGK